jgi:hypothetical protein
MQVDGNLVLYHVDNTPAWDSSTFGEGIFLAVQDDGNLVLYKPIVPVWATNTAGNWGCTAPGSLDTSLI